MPCLNGSSDDYDTPDEVDLMAQSSRPLLVAIHLFINITFYFNTVISL